MGASLPHTLAEALRPVTLVAGHYGVGKTNFACNLAIDLRSAGHEVTLIDLDIVNPYFRASEQRILLEEHGIRLVAPVFAEAGSSLDVPSLRGAIAPAIEGASEGRRVVIDVGGDEAGSVALGRFRRPICAQGYCMLGVINRYRNLVQQPCDAVENLREIEGASGLRITALVDNAHLKAETSARTIEEGRSHAEEVARLAGLPLVAVTVPESLADSFEKDEMTYPIKMYVRSPWE